jgi:hypothetical protein
MLSSTFVVVPLKGRVAHVYGSNPLEKIKNKCGCLLRFLFKYVGFQWVKKEFEKSLL